MLNESECNALARRLEAEARKHVPGCSLHSDLTTAAAIVRDAGKLLAFLSAKDSGELHYEPKEDRA